MYCCTGISMELFHTLGFSRCHNTFLSSPCLFFLKGRTRDLFVPCVDSLMGSGTCMPTNCSELLEKLRARV